MLESIQQSFYKSVFNRPLTYPFISSSFPFERFDVYRQTILENIRKALHLTFPGIWKLLGTECANSVAYAFCELEVNRPITGCLDDFGESFPDFLATVKELHDLPYLRDYAFYEWLKHKAYRAKDGSAINPFDLQTIPEDQIDDVMFSFIPSFFTFTSNFPIDGIQEIAENPKATAINLGHVQTYGIIARPQDEVRTFWISKELFAFVNALEQGQTLSQSAHKIQESDTVFDLSGAIHFMLQKKLITKLK